MKKARQVFTLALAAGLALGSQVVTPRASYALGQNAQTDNNIQAQLQNELKKYKDIQISVKNGVVDLEGTVNDFATKEEIDKEPIAPRMWWRFATNLRLRALERCLTRSCSRRSCRSSSTIA